MKVFLLSYFFVFLNVLKPKSLKNIFPAVLLFMLLATLSAQSQDVVKERVVDSVKKYLNLSSENSYKYQYKEAISFSNRALEYAYQIQDDYYLTVIYNELGLAYDGISEFSRSKKSYLESLRYAKKIENDTIKGWIYNNIGNLYSEGLKKTDSAIKYYKESLRYAEKLKDTFEILTPVLNIGWTYLDESDYDTAFPYLVKSQRMIFSKHGDDEGKAQVQFLLGRYYMHKEKFELADENFKSAIVYAKKEKIFDELTEIYEQYAILAQKQGNDKLAYDRLQTHIQYKDSLFSETQIKENQIALARFSVDDYKKDLERVKKEQKSQEIIMRKSQQISYVLMIAGLILVLLLINMFKNYKFRNKALEKLRLKNSELREAKEEAEAQASLKAQFFSTVSHELRTPLYGVVGLTSLLSEDFPNLKKNEKL